MTEDVLLSENSNWLRKFADHTIVRPRATVLRLNARRCEIPAEPLITGNEWTNFDIAVPMPFRHITLEPHRLVVYWNTVEYPETTADTAAPGVAWQEDRAFIHGNGVGQPLGILNAPATITVPREQGRAVTIRDLQQMMEAFLPGELGLWMVSRNAVSSKRSIFTARPDRWREPNVLIRVPDLLFGFPDLLFGFPVVYTDLLPMIGETGDVILADWRYYLIGHRQTTLQSNEYDMMLHRGTSYRIVHRIDGCPWLKEPMTYNEGRTVSPFVVLGGAARDERCSCVTICAYCGQAWPKGQVKCWDGYRGCGAGLLDPASHANIVCQYCGRIWPGEYAVCWDGVDGCGAPLGRVQ